MSAQNLQDVKDGNLLEEIDKQKFNYYL